MRFSYFKTVQVNDELEVEDIGNCAIRAFNDRGFEWILITKTDLGKTIIFNYGPVLVDMDSFPQNVGCSYQTIDFSQKALNKTIDMFLNGPNKSITQAEEVTVEEALEDCRSIVEHMKELFR